MQVSGSGGGAVDPAFYRAASAKQSGAAAQTDAPASSETGVKVRLGDPARRADDSPLYGATGRLASDGKAHDSTQGANAQAGSSQTSRDGADPEATADPQSGDAQPSSLATSTEEPSASKTASGSPESPTASSDKPAPSASPIKSFTYGTLGLESPAQQSEQKDSYYSAGRWLAAAVTIGGLISLIL